jgi:hypothetical protein
MLFGLSLNVVLVSWWEALSLTSSALCCATRSLAAFAMGVNFPARAVIFVSHSSCLCPSYTAGAGMFC